MGALDEEDVVPVLASTPRRIFQQRQQRPREDDVRRVVGEARGEVIPDDAEEIENTGGGTLTTRLRPIRDVVQEPSYPSGQREPYMAPITALTAPDITPKALAPLDPSSLPGTQATKFTSTQAQQEEPAQPTTEISAPENNTDKATRAMDVLLGRVRTGTPARTQEQMAQVGKIATEAQAPVGALVSEAQAQVALGLMSGENLLGRGTEMPPPVQGDGKTVFAAARRFF